MVARYEVFVTPIIQLADDGSDIYGDEVEITEDVQDGSISNIKRKIFRSDGDIGEFGFGSFSFTVNNIQGKYSQEYDQRIGNTIFPFERDRALVKLQFYDNDNNTAISFEGLIDEERVREDVENEKVIIQVRSLDSILTKAPIVGGLINNEKLVSESVKAVLDRPLINTLLTYSDANINVGYDYEIDNSNFFQPLSAKEALDELMLTSKSILYIDNSKNIIVRSRTSFEASATYTLSTTDIIDISDKNNGLQRSANQIVIEDLVTKDDNYIARYGLKKLDLSNAENYITNTTTRELVSEELLNALKRPKAEFTASFRTIDVKDVDLYDSIQINYEPYTVKAEDDNFKPLYGQARYDEQSYPFVQGGYRIISSGLYRVIEISHNIGTLRTSIKLQRL